MNSPIIQVREFYDGTWSVMARIWNPQKKFYEHPTLINLSKEQAQKSCQEIIEQHLTTEEIVDTWEFIDS